MFVSGQTPLLELETELWKARAQAKQKWLEQALSEQVTDPRAAARRMKWIRRALGTVKRGQDEVRYRAALTDAYAEHLSVLEMILMGAAERKGVAADPASAPEPSKASQRE